MKDFIELRHILAVIRGHLWSLVCIGAVAAALGLIVSQGQTPVYQATTTILVGQFMQSSSVNRVDIQTSTDVAKTYADIALRQPILSAVVEKLKLDQTWQDLKKQVHVTAIDGTQLIEVTAEAGAPAAARAIADSVAGQLIATSPTTLENAASNANTAFIRQQLDSVEQRLADGQARLQAIDTALAASPSEAAAARLHAEKSALEQSITEWLKNYVDLTAVAKQETAANNYLAIIEPAQATKDPVRPRVLLDTVIAGSAGLFLALALAFLRDYLDFGIRSPEQMEELLGLAPLAEIGTLHRAGWRFLRNAAQRKRPGRRGGAEAGGFGGMPSRTLVALERPRSPESESFRALRTNIQFSSVERPLHSLVVTSAVPGEGKTFVAANLAVVIAQTGKRVVLVDADLRRPSLHAIFGLPNRVGFTNLIVSGSPEGTVQQIPALPNLSILTSGPQPANPAELLDSAHVADVMSDLAERADLVIYDSPPMGAVTDPAILGARVDAVILVARAGATRRNFILSAKLALEHVGVKRILPVLNAVGPRDMSTYQGYYHRRARRDSASGEPAVTVPAGGPWLPHTEEPAGGAGAAETRRPDAPIQADRFARAAGSATVRIAGAERTSDKTRGAG